MIIFVFKTHRTIDDTNNFVRNICDIHHTHSAPCGWVGVWLSVGGFLDIFYLHHQHIKLAARCA